MDEGYALIKDLAPNTAQEYILKAVALTMVGQEHNSVSYTSGYVQLYMYSVVRY